MSQIQIRRTPRTEFLGGYYPGGSAWGTLRQTLQLERQECEEMNLLWLNGLCFNISMDNVIDIYYIEEIRETDRARLQHYYIVLNE